MDDIVQGWSNRSKRCGSNRFAEEECDDDGGVRCKKEQV